MQYFTADTHFSHQKIIEYCDRPYSNYKAMNASIIAKHNAVVTDADVTYFLGDVFLGHHPNELKGILNRMNGMKVLIGGNHDEFSPWDYIKAGFASYHTYLKVTLSNGEMVNLIHDPSAACITEKIIPGKWLVGHVHNLFKDLDNGRVINVGVDTRQFTPMSELEIINYDLSS